MFCEKCGSEVKDGSVFCLNCGSKLENAEFEQKVLEKKAAEDDDKTVILEEQFSNENKTEIQKNSETKAETVPVVEKTIPIEKNASNEKNTAADNVKADVSETANKGKVFCHNCGVANSANDTFCFSCGSPLEGAYENKYKKNVQSKKIIKAVAAVAGVAVVVAGGLWAANNLGKKDALIYLTDNEIKGMSKKDDYVIGENAYQSEENISGYGSNLGYTVQVSEDKKYVYYPKNYTYDSFDLYCKKFGDKNAEEIKIDKNVSDYKVLKNGKVIYLRSDSKLYISDMKDENKIDSNVSSFTVSEDEKNIFWVTVGGKRDMFVCDTALKKDKKKLDKEIDTIYYISDDLQQIVYTKEESLYNISKFDNKQKIDSNVSDVSVSWTEDGAGIYYIKNETETKISYMDMINDDLASQDSKIVEPDISKYQHQEVKPSFWGDRMETVTDDAYYTELDKYAEKRDRDDIRESLKHSFATVYERELYYYVPGKEEAQLVADGIIESRSVYSSGDAMFYNCFDEDNIEKINFSEIVNDYDTDELEEKYYDSMRWYIVKGTKQIELDADFDEYGNSLTVAGIDKSEGEAYFTLYNNNTYENTLLKTDIDKMDGKTEVVTEEIGDVKLVTDNGVYYTVDVEDSIGEMYCNGKKIAEDVYIYDISNYKDGEGIMYLSDVDIDDGNVSGTLSIYKDGKIVEVNEDVTTYECNSEGNVAFLVDYNYKYNRGDLMLYKNGKVTSVEDDVTSILYY